MRTISARPNIVGKQRILVESVQLVDFGLVGAALVLMAFGAWLSLSSSTQSAGIALLLAGGALAPVGNLVAALRLEESVYVAVVFGLFIGGVAVLVLGIVLLTVLGSTESPRSITGITLITAGAALLPTGAKPPPVTPIATTNEGHLVDSQHAILRGTVDPKGQLVAWQFVYGGDGTVPYPAATVPRYLSDSEVTNKVKGEDKIDVSAQVPGVEGMHFRLVAASITSGTTDIGVDTEVRLTPPA